MVQFIILFCICAPVLGRCRTVKIWVNGDYRLINPGSVKWSGWMIWMNHDSYTTSVWMIMLQKLSFTEQPKLTLYVLSLFSFYVLFSSLLSDYSYLMASRIFHQPLCLLLCFFICQTSSSCLSSFSLHNPFSDMTNCQSQASVKSHKECKPV